MDLLSKVEKEHLKKLGEVAGRQLSNNRCNDYETDNTDENWKLVEEMEASNLSITVEEWRKHKGYERRPEGRKLMMYDWVVFGHLIEKATR